MSVWHLVLQGPGHHGEPIEADHSVGRRVYGQLDLAAVLLRDLGLPALVLQVLHQRNDNMSPFGHFGQETWNSRDRYGLLF